MTTGPDSSATRIGTSERDEAAQLLSQHFSEGRLSTDEFDERTARAMQAWTRDDVRPLFDDLPAPHPSVLAAPAHRPGREATTSAPLRKSGSRHSTIIGGVLQIVFPFGIGRFYTGHTKTAVIQLVCTLITLGAGAIWPFIDGIVLLIRGIEGNHE